MTNIFINSTLDINSKAILKKAISVDKIVEGYKRDFNIDVQKYFSSNENIFIYECQNTKFQFYYPFGIEGDSSFYEQLQKFDWYYMPWKWEHQKVKEILKGNEKVLEVGSGDFGFIEKMNQLDFDIVGLELNEEAILKAKQKNLNVIEETIQDHAHKMLEYYDVVCSFQVLEHIADVRSFLESQMLCLKKGGKLIVGVPNNKSFIRFCNGGLLNKPPHHMGLWDEVSLKKLAGIFNIKLERIYFEPLQDYHVQWYLNTIYDHKIARNRILRGVFKIFKLKPILLKIIKINQKNIQGHTMIAVFSKTQ